MIRWTSNSWSFLLYHLSTHIRFWPVALQFFVPTPSSGLDFARIVSHSSQSSANTNTGFRKKQDHPSLHHTTSCFGGTEQANQLQLQNMNKKKHGQPPKHPALHHHHQKKTSYRNLTYSVTPHTPNPQKKGSISATKTRSHGPRHFYHFTNTIRRVQGAWRPPPPSRQWSFWSSQPESWQKSPNGSMGFFGAQLLKLASCLLVGRIWKLPLSVSSWKKKGREERRTILIGGCSFRVVSVCWEKSQQ